MKSYGRQACEITDLERWENEGGRVCKGGSERDFQGRHPKGRRMSKNRLSMSFLFSDLARADRSTPFISLRNRQTPTKH